MPLAGQNDEIASNWRANASESARAWSAKGKDQSQPHRSPQCLLVRRLLLRCLRMLLATLLGHLAMSECAAEELTPPIPAATLTVQPPAGTMFSLRPVREECRPAKLFSWNIDRAGGAGEPAEESKNKEDTIETDRPDFTQNRKTVGLGVRQVESGFTFLRGSTHQYESYSFPETLFRAGVWADWFELRIGQNFGYQTFLHNDGRRQNAQGAYDLYLGIKLALTPQEGILPEMGLIVQMSVPSGSPALTAGAVMPGVNWLYGWDIVPDFISLTGSTQANRTNDIVPLPRGGTQANHDHTHDFVVVAQSFSLDYQITEPLSGYVEWFAFFPCGALAPTMGPEEYFDTGFLWLLTPNVQFDVRSGWGLNSQANRFFAGSGLSFRY